MKIILPLTVSLLLVACGKEEPPSSTPPPALPPKPAAESKPGQNPATAPVDYLGVLAQGKKTAEKNLDTAALNQQVQLFYAQEGRWPKSLDELVTQKYIKKLPDPPYGMKIEYDAAKGTVKVVAGK